MSASHSNYAVWFPSFFSTVHSILDSIHQELVRVCLPLELLETKFNLLLQEDICTTCTQTLRLKNYFH